MRVKTDEGFEDLRAIWMEDENIKMIDQRLLPHELRFHTVSDHHEVKEAIKKMVIRGAPSIGAAAAYGIAQAILKGDDLKETAEVIKSARPTAYDLFYAVDHMMENGQEKPKITAEAYVDSVVSKCKAIGDHGGKMIDDGMKILTHCNAGALATVDHGTALAPIRHANSEGKDIFVFVDETRPRLQGSMLTAWELFNEDISHAVIVDNAAGHFMHRGEVDMVIVGTDRVAANGDVANKIGTYEKAVIAKENDIPFYVALPVTTFDPDTKSGTDIPIEEREGEEVSKVFSKYIMPKNSPVMNPAFDVTLSKYITGFITEKGIFSPDKIGKLL